MDRRGPLADYLCKCITGEGLTEANGDRWLDIAGAAMDYYKERVGSREGELAYQRWHLELGPQYYCYNVDKVEVDVNRSPLVMMEMIRMRGPGDGNFSGKLILNYWEDAWWRAADKRQFYSELRGMIGRENGRWRVPAYFVVHQSDHEVFWIAEIAAPPLGPPDPCKLTGAEFAEWIMGFREGRTELPR